MKRTRLFTGVVIAILLTTSPVWSQDNQAKVRPTGLSFDAGVVLPENAESGLVYGGTLNLGSLWKSWLHLSAGVSRWSADIDRTKLGSATSGSIADTRVFTALSIEPFEISSMRPYVNVAFASHFIDAKISNDPNLQDALSGTSYGPEVGFGIVSHPGRIVITTGVRHEFVDDVKNWTFSFGLGMRWGGARQAKQTSVSTETQTWDRPVNAPETPHVQSPSTPSNNDVLSQRFDRLEAENAALRERVRDLERQGTKVKEDDRDRQLSIQFETVMSALNAALSDVNTHKQSASNPQPLLVTIPGSLLFDTGQTSIQSSAMVDLQSLAETLKSYPGARMEIEGHTDSVGDQATNLRLSEERANAVRDMLIRMGIGHQRLTARGAGSYRPVATNATPGGRAQNRRVEIRITTGS
jgi:outer membrane protein OmpA-like peptidoglycan-associated protein